MTNNKQSTSTRRKFLGGAAVAGVATIAMPQVSRAQTVTLKMQSGFGPTRHPQRLRPWTMSPRSTRWAAVGSRSTSLTPAPS